MMGTVQQAAEWALHLAPVVLRGQAAVLLVCLPPRISPIQNPLKALWNIPTLPTFFQPFSRGEKPLISSVKSKGFILWHSPC